MVNVSSQNEVKDPVLTDINQRVAAITCAILALYDAIREAKENNYSYNELGIVTGMPRGTIQNIAAGKNPRFSVEKES